MSAGSGAGAARGFASDNRAGVHPAVMAALAEANQGHAPSYGHDDWSARAEEVLRAHFGPQARAFFVFNGTGANVAAIDALTQPHEAVICSEVAHMHTDECGAPERLAGVKLLTVPAEHGKLDADDLRRWEQSRGDEHQVQPRVVSISQASELGTVHTPEETRAIADTAHELGMYVHLDGARLANAAAALDAPLGALTTDAGVDVVSFGATKNGALGAEAVVFCRAELAGGFEFTRKQLTQLASKSRFLAVQFEALLRDQVWLENARGANAMAARLAAGVGELDGVEITHPVEANAVFARLPRAAIDRLLAELPGEEPFYVWDEARDEVRWMCAWDTTPEDVDRFVEVVARALRS